MGADDADAGHRSPSQDELILRALDALPEASLVVFDTQMRYVLVRGGAVQDNEMGPEHFEGHRAADVLDPRRWEFYEPVYEATLRGEDPLVEVQSPDGTRDYLMRCKPLHDDGGAIVGGMILATEITELRQVQRGLQSAERQFRIAMESAPIGMAVVDLHRRFLDVNDSLCRMLDLDRQQLVGTSVAEYMGDEDAERDRLVRHLIWSGERDWVVSEKELARGSGGTIWVQHAVGLVRDHSGAPLHFVSQFVDITEARADRQRLAHKAAHDDLTGLLNRAGLLESLRPLLAERRHAGAGVLFLDIDDFKSINDRYGHIVGDEVLKTVAGWISGSLRADDLAARIGGDEFVAVLPTLSRPGELDAVLAKVRSACSGLVDVGEATVTVRSSVGGTVAAQGESIEDVLARADAALYAAKATRGSGDA